MLYLCSRGGMRADGRSFTALPGTQTSFLRVSRPHLRAAPGHRIDPHVWAREVLGQSRDGKVLLIIHEFRIPQNAFLKEVANIRKRLGHQFRGAIVALDWPTNGKLFHYIADRRDAKATATHLFKDCIMALRAARRSVKIHVLAHSMGCFFLNAALQAALGRPFEQVLKSSLQTVSVTAADVDQDWSQAY